MDNNSLSHTKWNCKYHIVFAPKYRRKVAYGKIKQDIADILSMLCKRKGVKIVESRDMSRSCTHVSRNSAKHKCIVFCRVLKRKEYINDIRKTCKSEVQIWKQTFLVSRILCRYGREKCKENTGIYSKSVTG